MSLNALIAQGGTNVASPVQRYMQVRKDQQAEQRNALAMDATRQQMAASQQGMDINERKQLAVEQEQRLKMAAPVLRQILALPQDQQDAVYQQQKEGLSEMFGAKTMPETFDPQIANSVVQHVYGAPEAPTKQTIHEGAEKVDQRWNEVTGKWEEVGRGITSTQTAEPGGFRKPGKADKDLETAIGAEEGLRNLGTNINRIKKQLNESPDYIGGTTGSLVKMINSGAMQFDQLLGRRDPLAKPDGSIDSTQIGKLSKENAGWVRRAALQGTRVDSAIIELAFTHAKVLNNSGKISDADIKYARDIIEGGADKAIKIDSLNNLLERGYSNYQNQRESRKGRGSVYSGWKDIPRTDIFGEEYQSIDPLVNQPGSVSPAVSSFAKKALEGFDQ